MKDLRVVVIGANGNVGKLFCDILDGKVRELVRIDRQAAPGDKTEHSTYIISDATDLSAEAITAIRSAHCVLVCLPENATITALPAIIGNLPPASLWVDTLSVKSRICPELVDLSNRYEVVSINPMFAPSLGFEKQNVVVVSLSDGPIGKMFLSLLKSRGAVLTFMSADEHDQLTAATQVVTHAAIISFGSALKLLGYDVKLAMRAATPVHVALLSLISRILALDPEVYWDIQYSNPFAREGRQKLIEAMIELNDNVNSEDQDAFRTVLEELRSLIKSEYGKLTSISSHLLGHLNSR